MWLANIFSNSVGYLFVLLIVSFAVQKVLSLIMSLLVLFCCCYLCLRRQIQTNIAMIFGKKMFCPCFLLSFLWFPALACRSLIHFEFIFVCGVRKCSNFILLRVAVQFFYSSCFCVSTILSDFCSFVV